jgi:hypothetical protein
LRNKINYESNELKSNWERSRMKSDQIIATVAQRTKKDFCLF